MKKKIYTIGYTAVEIDRFISILKKYNISCLIDVRSIPLSKFYVNYNKENLARVLKENEIIYRNYDKEFGARQTNKAFYVKEGYLDFEKFAHSDIFLEGIKKINKGLELNQSFVLMCAEKDPINCHRAILIGRQLFLKEFDVEHIVFDNGEVKTIDQGYIDKELVNEYFPNREQLSIFENENLSYDDYVRAAYKLKNKEIGFKIKEEE